MKVLIKVQPLGLYNGQVVHAKKGEVADLPDELADGLVRGGLAEPVDDEPPTEPEPTEPTEPEPPVVETATVTETAAETTTTTEPTAETTTVVEPKAEKRTGRGARGTTGG